MDRETKVLVVMGMHRSGTSALAKGLEVFGADLGANLMPATQANPKGYHEDLDVWPLNSALLESTGCAWQSIAKPDEQRREAVFKAAEVETLCLIAIREPAHTAALLMRTENIPLEQGYYLWLSYILAALENTHGSTTVLVDYAKLLTDPSAELRRIGHAFNLTADNQRLRTYSETFVCSDLNRSAATA